MVSLSSRRRTLSRPDVAQAIAKSDMFDFLIDIVPRDIPEDGEARKATGKHADHGETPDEREARGDTGSTGSMVSMVRHGESLGGTGSTGSTGSTGRHGKGRGARGRVNSPSHHSPPKRRTTGRRTRQVPEGDNDEGEGEGENEEEDGDDGDEGLPSKRQRTGNVADGGETEEAEDAEAGFDLPAGGYAEGLSGWPDSAF